ncbi:ribosomal protein L10 [Thermoplasmatales archaeon SCGC AB-539-C06]|nr:ribosomal protein L10 [Thermoplasmatales archaeon SCGC AB-539-C06]
MVEARVSEYKKKVVDEFVKLIKEYPIIATVNLEMMPTPQLQVMRGKLRGKVVLRMSKRRLMKIAIEKTKADKKDIEKLEPYLKGMPALLFTKESPFKLNKILVQNKSKAPAKAGQTAPNDIVIPAGPTPFAPGPIIGELGMIGIKSGVEGGKVAVKEDSVVAKEGEVIKPKVAEILTRLNIKPMEIGLDLTAAYEDGVIYTKDVLSIDEKAFMEQLNTAATEAFNLAVEAGYFTKDTVELLLPKAFNEAKALALEANIMADAIAEELVAKAEMQAKTLKEETKYEEKIKTEEVKAEEKKEEASKPETTPAASKEEAKSAGNVKEKTKEAKPEEKEEPKKE